MQIPSFNFVSFSNNPLNKVVNQQGLSVVQEANLSQSDELKFESLVGEVFTFSV